ncbi:MAG: hypothetical protein GY756_02085 [bacterium]|nr:hypothetical protein [bacterium]
MSKIIFRFSFLAVGLLMICSCSRKENDKINLHTSNAIVTKKTRTCLECHTKKQPGLVGSWKQGAHAKAGVGCYECHSAKKGEKDAFEHYDNTISVIVSPKDCSRCHAQEAEQFLGSHHAKAGEVLGSLDNYLGEVVEGGPASVSGCQQCHGSEIKVMEDGKLSPDTWPNFGIGRINPDGTKGSCAACHTGHDYSLETARSPETCGKCHMGPDHPQLEVYEESRHGTAYRTHKNQMNMSSKSWIVGKDYFAAPTCATCHMGATMNQSRTHDIAERISVNLRAKISFKTKDSERKRRAMQDVCLTCHSPTYVNNFYKQFDQGVDLYNNKFGIPAADIMKKLYKNKKLDSTPFNEKIEWTYFFLWHHEGRRARTGLAMMGPDYVQWHGFFELAERLYFELFPEAEHLEPGITKKYMERPENKWFSGKLTKEEREQMKSYYKRYPKSSSVPKK